MSAVAVLDSTAVLDGTTNGYAAPRPVPGRSPRPRLVLVPTGDSVRQLEPQPLRLTRAGRLVLTSATVFVALLVAFVAFTGFAAASSPAETVTVQPGQTLSEIAAEHLTGGSIAAGVSALRDANDLPSAQVQAGQTLVIPAD